MSTSADTAAPAEEAKKIQLDVKVTSPQSCIREVVVTIPRDEVDRYRTDAFNDLVPEAVVPGFRAGRAPRKLVEKQFRDKVQEQVKGALLMDSLSQVTESESFSAISEPDFDYESIQMPEAGDFKYQFTIEVRPEFQTPEWKSLQLVRPVETIGDAEIAVAMDRVLKRYNVTEATDQPARKGDTLLITATFRDGEQFLSEMDEEKIELQSRLSLEDAIAEDFGKVMEGITEGEAREVMLKISDEAADEAMRGKTITGLFTAVEVYHDRAPELTPAFLRELGDFDSEEELRAFVKDSLERQATYRTQQALRARVVELLTGSVQFDLPPNLVRKQTARELERKVLELRSSNFDENAIRRYVNATRRNAQAMTEAALREHFILEQIAEEQSIDAEPADYDREIRLIAEQSDMTERRVRARLEKNGQIDVLRNQIVERKVIELIVENANVTDQPVANDTKEADDEFAVYHSILGGSDLEAIPEAQYDDHKSMASGEKEKD